MQNHQWLKKLKDLVFAWEVDFEDMETLLEHPGLTSDDMNLIHEMQDNIVACSHIAEKLHDCYAIEFRMGHGEDFSVREDDYHSW